LELILPLNASLDASVGTSIGLAINSMLASTLRSSRLVALALELSFSLPPAIIFSFSIRIDAPRQHSSLSFVDAALSTDASLPINSSCQSIPLLVSMLMRLRVDAFLFASPANVLLSFLPPTNTTSLLYCRLVLGVVLASIPVDCSSCRSHHRYTLVMVFLC